MPHALCIMCNKAEHFFTLMVLSITLLCTPVAAHHTEWPFLNIHPQKYRQPSRVQGSTAKTVQGAKNVSDPEANVSSLMHRGCPVKKSKQMCTTTEMHGCCV